MERFNFLAIVLAIWIVTVSCESGDEEAVNRGNNFVDKVLRDIAAEHGDEYDPYYLEDRVVGFHKKVVFVDVSGEAKLHDGFINGLSSLSRSGNCNLQETDSKLKVEAKLQVKNIEMEYSGTAKFMNIGLTIRVHGKVDYMNASMKMHCDAKDGLGGFLNNLKVDEIKGMKVWITGLGPLNWAVDTIINALKSIFSGFLHRVIEKNIAVYVAVKVADYQFPVDGVDVDYTTSDDSIVTEPAQVGLSSESTILEELVDTPDEETDTNENIVRRMKWNY